MDVPDPRVRRRGYFFDVEPQSPDYGEHEAPEGMTIRLGSTRKPTHAMRPTSLGKDSADNSRAQDVRSASATGSHRPSRTPR
jgi:hypothetical protein